MSGLEIIDSCIYSLFNTTSTLDPLSADGNGLATVAYSVALAFFAAKAVYDNFSWSSAEVSEPSIKEMQVEEKHYALVAETAEPKPLSEKFSDPLNIAVIERINQAREEGKKVILVIGRHDAEPLPKEEDDAVYVSLDEQPRSIVPPAEDRLHLQMEFNSKFDFYPMHSLFDTVIVDFSTMKSVDNWDILKPLLHPSPDSTLITEVPIVSFLTSDKETEATRLENLRRPHFYIPPNAFARPSLEKPIKKIQLSEKTNYLKTLFKSVEVHENASYPTRTPEAYGHRHPLGQGLKANLFVMKNPL
ncbi:hypothetical protein [Simkania sp.]|uniref:hypothetical protein n=1 Tax=Simkania sp. TaxID=34094 RepID=UPI003B519232